MIPEVWSTGLSFYLWQVALHSSVAGLIFYAWVHRLGLRSSATKRRLLVTLLVLPLLTAAVPGRDALDFAERLAWLNSARILAIPLGAGTRVQDLLLVIAAIVTGVTFWQEVLPAFRRPKAVTTDVPESLVQLVRTQTGWETCKVAVSPASSILVVTSGWRGAPTLIVSLGALQALSEAELAAVVAHEHAHWLAGRWTWSHLLFAVRMLQCYHPVALWVFREYCLEIEISCDRTAAAGRRDTLVRALLRAYKSLGHRDHAARAALRKRVDVLMQDDAEGATLPGATVATATLVMLMVLPWIV